MNGTEWVGGRIASPLFVEDRGGFQADVIVWMDVTHDKVVSMTAAHPDESDKKVADTFREALTKPAAGPRRPPDRVRVASERLAGLVSGISASLPVTVAPTPEIERFIEFMGETMPGASPQLAAFRTVLRERRESVLRLLPAMAQLFRAAPWSRLWDSEIVQLDIPELDVSRACVSVMGRAKQSWGLVLFGSADEYHALRDVSEARDDGPPVDLGAEALSLSYSAASELPSLIRREIVDLGWDLKALDVYPMWFHSLRSGKTRMPSERELRILLAMAVGCSQHVGERGEAFATLPVLPRTTEHRVETESGTVTARITSPHPDVPWNREPELGA